MLRAFLVLFLIPACLYAQEQQQWVDSIYTKMSLDQKIGQLFMVMAFPDGNFPTQQKTIHQVKKQHIGGILFSKGSSIKQLQDTKRYQRFSETPLLVAADAEWGMAMRLQDVSPYPYAMTLGALPNDELVYALAKQLGTRKRKMGVHISFAPVADINTEADNPIIGVRAFGDNPIRVAKKAQAFMEGLQDAGVIAVAKHFPGHGASTADSHKTLPRINRSKKALDSIDLVPFKHLISIGLKGIMVGHLDVPALDNSGLPIAASKKVVTQLLQQQLGFNGLVFTDALDMKGITTAVDSPALAAFLAGADVLVMPLQLEKAISALKTSYANGDITEARLATSVKKILSAKYALGLHQNKTVKTTGNPLPNTFYDTYLRKQIAEQSIVEVHAQKDAFPLQKDTTAYYVSLGKPSSNDFLYALREQTTTVQILKNSLKTTELTGKAIVVGIHANTSSPWTNQSLSESDIAVL
ncbi:MAG: beta-N-acetylglucosaminidase, partial [Bacteroidetes bacterium]|nr:beta-N-acetylglucosaminidase [Bacteroidota bacterium]